MARHPKAFFLTLASLAAFALLLAACGGSGPATSATSGRAALASGLTGTDNQIWFQTLTDTVPAGPNEGARFGSSVASGDFDGDGFEDLAVGIPFDNGARGAVNVFSGSADGISDAAVQGWKQGAGGLAGVDEEEDRFGYSLAAGNFNGDDFDDLAIGVPGDNTAAGKSGAVFVLYGSATGLVPGGSQLWFQDGGDVPGEAREGDSFGFSLAAGDFDGDGNDDLAIGVPNDNTAAGDSGAVNVLYGSPTGLAGAGSQIWNRDGDGLPGDPEESDSFGYALAAGDFDGDGNADLAVGVPGDNTALVRSGSVTVLFGSGTGLSDAGSRSWSAASDGVPGDPAEGDLFGYSLASGDFDGDGAADLAVGAPGTAVGDAEDAGAVTVLYGASGAGLSGTGSQSWSRETLQGTPQAGDAFGSALAAGDFEDDGDDDLAVGVPNDDGGAEDAGAVNVIYGSPEGLSALRNQLWTQAGLEEGGAEAGDAFGRALAGGDFDGDNTADLAIGAPGEDLLVASDNVVDAGVVNVLYGTRNLPPVADAGPDQTVAANDDCLGVVQLDGTGSFDPDGDPLTYTWTWDSHTASGPTPTVVLPLGSTTITLTVEDGFGGMSTDNVVITVEDRTPPVILALEAVPETLWPPNHKFVPVVFTALVRDNCDANPVPRIESIESNEPVDGLGDGNTEPDWIITGNMTAELRAERSGRGSGRVYTATISVTDFAGNVATGTEEVTVPHDQR